MSPQLFPDREQSAGAHHVITIGNFDGVHLGHQHLIEAVVSSAKQRGDRSAVLTFDPLPLEVLRPESRLPRLTSTPDRLELMRGLGVDEVIPVPFSREVAALNPAEFIKQVVVALHPTEIIVGADFAFGHNRSGNPDVLRQLGREYGYTVRIIDRIGDARSDFSSSLVRARLGDGDVKHAADLLGRPFFLRGMVTQGKRRGRQLGFPTANLRVLDNVIVPADGIYAAMTRTATSDELIPSMVYMGTNPTFEEESRAVEVNLIDFSGDLYGSVLTVLFVDRVRGDQWFESADALVAQMHRDQRETERMIADIDVTWPGDALRAILGIGKGALTGDR
ncbi:MAG: bifunctional riboflavin kinase/FAD synthetase [Nitrolancea sp.]